MPLAMQPMNVVRSPSDLALPVACVEPLLLDIDGGRRDRLGFYMREEPATMVLFGSTRVGHSRKTNCDVGNLEVVIIGVQVNALPIDIRLIPII